MKRNYLFNRPLLEKSLFMKLMNRFTNTNVDELMNILIGSGPINNK